MGLLLVSLSQLQEVPPKSMILLVGAPGSGKSTFCHRSVLNNLATNKPVIFVTTEHAPSDVTRFLRERGLGETPSGVLNFVDAFHKTVGLSTAGRPDTVYASCGDLTSIEVAISKVQDRIRRKNVLLVFDSLTSPYLLNGEEIIRFLRLSLAKFSAEGNSVLACMDEGCSKEEDLGAMMSIANGIIKLELEDGSRILNIVKHPVLEPTRVKVPMAKGNTIPFQTLDAFIAEYYRAVRSGFQASFRSEMGDFVNVFWRSFTFWSGMHWDPKRFPTMLYELIKELTFQGATLFMMRLPWHVKLIHKFLPKKTFRSPKFVEKRLVPIMAKPNREAGGGIMKYLPEISKTDEHHIRICEGASCWGLENVGGPLCYEDAANLAGFMKFFDGWRGKGREWNAVETTCVGEGASYCQFKVAPMEMDELEDYLTSVDASMIENIIDRLNEHVKDFILDQKPLGERPTLGSGVHTHEFLGLLTLPALASERYQIAVRMAGAMAGKRLGEQFMNLGLREDEATRRMVDLLEYCKVGKVSMDDTIRMKENCESFGIEGEKPTCFFTTGFFNGFFSAVKNQHVKETKCIAMGDPYCEWELS
jgi:predicted hydrocarbon binding protein/KaiC/GvpD/RAD55 family RecA-like ATPase